MSKTKGEGNFTDPLNLLTVGRVHAEVDGDRRETLVRAREAVRLALDFLANLVKVGEDLSLAVRELAVLW